MNITPVKTNEEAQIRLASKIDAAYHDGADLTIAIEPWQDGDVGEMQALVEAGDLLKLSARQWNILRLQNTLDLIKRLQATQKADLIFPDGQYLLLPVGEQLISPAGFHPDERVFIKPSAGAIVSKLPKSSNLAYYDFTK